MITELYSFKNSKKASSSWGYVAGLTAPFVDRMIWVGAAGLALAAFIQFLTGTHQLFMYLNCLGVLLLLALVSSPRPVSVASKAFFLAAYFWLQILASLLSSGLLGTAEIMTANFIVFIVIVLRPLPGLLLSAAAVLNIFVFTGLVDTGLVSYSSRIFPMLNSASHWLVQGVAMAVFSVIAVSLVNYYRNNLLATISNLELSNKKLISLNQQLEHSRNRLSMLAYTDELTRLPNRIRFQKYVEERIHAEVDSAFLVLINLENFRTINTLYGTDYGDRLLQLIGLAFRGLLVKHRFIARLVGDEFAFWIEDIEKEQLEREVEKITSEASACLEKSSEFRHRLQFNTAAVRFPDDGASYQECMRAATATLKASKEQPEPCVLFYDETIMRSLEYEQRMLRLLERALIQNEFNVVYQPKVNLKTNQIQGLEALTRWSPPELGPTSPEAFIRLLTKQGLIFEFTKKIVEQVLSDMPELLCMFGSSLSVSINISPVVFLEDDFVKYLSSALEAGRVPPEKIILEITEDVFVDDPEKIQQVITELQGLGIGVSLDDFGKGYSSLSYISSFDFTELKVDRQFIRDIAENERSLSLFQTICRIASIYGYRVVAEGVENEKQVKALLQTCCDLAQGSYFAMPEPLICRKAPVSLFN